VSKKETIETKTWELAEPLTRELGLIPVDAEYVKDADGYKLVVTIDKEGGVGINDCEAMSRALDPLLDEGDFIPDVYTLIVTSPGLGRPLKRPRDFVFAKGREVDVKTYKAVDGTKEFRGILADSDKETVTIVLDGEERTFTRKEIAKIALAVDF